MILTREDVLKVSRLARLELSEAELVMLTGQLASIVGYFKMLEELETSEIEPMAHAADIRNVLRDDVVTASADRMEILAQSPHHDGEFFLIPAVLGE